MDESLLFILLLIAVAFLIVAFTHISLLVLSATKWKREAEVYRRHEEITAKSEKNETGGDNGDRTTANFAALINAIKAEGRANRAEEKREDEAGKNREWLTILLIAFTFFAVCWQVKEMVRVYGPIKDQADAAKKAADAAEASQRAWLGQTDARIDGPKRADGSSYEKLTVGKSIVVSVSYRNSGREPATSVNADDVIPRIYTTKQWTDGTALNEILQLQGRCKDAPAVTTGTVIFPSDNPNTTLISDLSIASASHPSIIMTDGIFNGADIIALLYCIRYRTVGSPHHTAFGYYFQAGLMSQDHLAIIQPGNSAD